MPKIEIVEIDATTPGVLAESNEVVYVPGFVDVASNFPDPKDALPVNKPYLFTSISGFESLCGTKGAVFNENQTYSGLSAGWTSSAKPLDDILIMKGTVDPGYVMAKELLAAGLNVMYERVNPDVLYTYSKTAGTERLTTMFTGALPDTAEQGMLPVSVGDMVDSNAKYFKTVGIGQGMEALDDYSIIYQEVTSIPESDQENGRFIVGNVYFTNPGYGFRVNSAVTANKLYLKAASTQGTFIVTKASKDNETGLQCLRPAIVQAEANGNTYYCVDPEWKNKYWVSGVIKSDMYLNTSESVSGTIETGTEDTNSAIMTTELSEYRTVRPGFHADVMYNALEGLFAITDDGISDKGNYNIKYLTTGGYPVYQYNNGSVVSAMLNLAETRGDCFALIDHSDNPDRDLNIDRKTSLYYAVSNDASLTANGEYGAMFTPWCVFNRTTNDTELVNGVSKLAEFQKSVRMPASFGYLLALADSIKTNASWLAVAGVARGTVPNLATNGVTVKIPNGIADKMQPRTGMSVNAITNIRSYGDTIWGNRTLKRNAENLVATSFLNIRNMMCDIKKVCYSAARSLTFEQNTEVLWVNLKSKIAPTLDRMMSGYGISGYKIVRDTTHEKAAEKATLCAKIILYPVYAVEDFYITITLTDDEVTVQ